MSFFSKLAKVFGFKGDSKTGATPEQQVQLALDTLDVAGSASKVAKIMGITEEDATILLQCAKDGDEEGYRAHTEQINITEGLQSTGLMRSRG